MINLRKKINLKKEDLIVRNKGVEELRIKYGVEKVENKLKEFIINGINVGLFRGELKINEDSFNCFLDSVEIDDSFLVGDNMDILYLDYLVESLDCFENVYVNWYSSLNLVMVGLDEFLNEVEESREDNLYLEVRKYCKSIDKMKVESLLEDLRIIKRSYLINKYKGLEKIIRKRKEYEDSFVVDCIECMLNCGCEKCYDLVCDVKEVNIKEELIEIGLNEKEIMEVMNNIIDLD